MVGNSWIYKSKYNEDSSSTTAPSKKSKKDGERGRGDGDRREERDKPGFGRSQTGNSIKSDSGVQEVLREERMEREGKKKRDKSRTRTMFGLRKVRD